MRREKAQNDTGKNSDSRETIETLKAELEAERAKTRELSESIDEWRLRFRTILDTYPANIWVKDVANNIIFVNRSAAQSQGLPVEDIENRSSYELYPDEAAGYFADDKKVIDSGMPKEGIVEQLVTFSGEKRWVRTDKFPVRNRQGKINGVLVIAVDITDLVRQKDERETLMVQVARALEESQERYYLAVRGSNDGLWDWNLHTNEVFYSPRYKELLGYRDDEFANVFDSFASNVHPDDLPAVMSSVEAHLEEGLPYEAEFRMRNKAGRYIWFSARGQAVWDESGKPYRMAGSQRDISDRKQAEQNVSEFFSTVSHELRTPLSAIKGSLRIIEGGLAGQISREAQDMLEIALFSCERLIRLVNDILDLRRLEAGKLDLRLTETRSDKLVRQLLTDLEPMAQQARIKLIAENKHKAVIKADVDRILQVLTNLVSNAIKFSSSKSTVKVVVEKTQPDVVRFSVVDQGPGIPPEKHNEVFKKFKQLDQSDSRRQEGSGLGLAISKAIVNQHKGQIGVDSKPGDGSTFWIELACVPESKPRPEKSKKS